MSVKNSQAGNALMYVLIAVALLAALSYAVAQSGRGGIQQLNKDRAKMVANEIIEYGNVIANATAQLRLRGCSDTQITFENPETGLNVNAGAPADKTCHVFDPAGGGVTYHTFKTFAAPGDVKFTTGTEGMENTGNSDQADLWMRIDSTDDSASSMGKQICAEINAQLQFKPEDDVATVGFEPIIDGDWADTQFVGTYPTVSGADHGTLNGLSAFCVGHDVDEVSYFRLLMAR